MQESGFEQLTLRQTMSNMYTLYEFKIWIKLLC